MRVHIFDAIVGEHHYRGLAFNKKGEKLKQTMTLPSSNITLEPSAWEYFGETVIHDDGTPKMGKLVSELKSRGFVVSELPKPATHFFVFDLEMDAGQFRLYSADRDLKRFHEFRKALELGVDGDRWQGEAEQYLDEIDIPSKERAKALGIEDYAGLLARGFHISLVRANSGLEFIEKRVVRDMNKKTAEMGIEVKSVRIQLEKADKRAARDTLPAGEKEKPMSGETPPRKSHIEAGTPIILAILGAITLMGLISIIAGLILYYMGASGTTEMSLFGNSFKSQNVGVACLFIGVLIVAATARRAFTSMERLMGGRF